MTLGKSKSIYAVSVVILKSKVIIIDHGAKQFVSCGFMYAHGLRQFRGRDHPTNVVNQNARRLLHSKASVFQPGMNTLGNQNTTRGKDGAQERDGERNGHGCILAECAQNCRPICFLSCWG
jgi:hypothetical protein